MEPANIRPDSSAIWEKLLKLTYRSHLFDEISTPFKIIKGDRDNATYSYRNSEILRQHALAWPREDSSISNWNVLVLCRIQGLSESGVLEKLRLKWVPTQKCAGLTFTQSKPAGLDDTQGAFIVLAFGVGLSIIALVSELVWHYCIRKKVRGKKLGPITFGSEVSISDNKVRPILIRPVID